MAGALTGALFAERQETAETPIGFAIRWIDQERCPALQIEAASDDETDARYLGRFMGTHHAGERIPVSDADRPDAQQRCRREQLFGGRRAAQKGKMRRDLKLGVAHASPTPCSHQLPPCPVGPS